MEDTIFFVFDNKIEWIIRYAPIRRQVNLAWKVIHQQYKLELEWRGFSTGKRDFWVVWRSPPMLHIVFAKSFLFIKRIIGRDHSASVLFSITSKYRYILSSSPIFEILDNHRRRQQILMPDTFSKNHFIQNESLVSSTFFNFHNLKKLLQSQHFYYIKLWYFLLQVLLRMVCMHYFKYNFHAIENMQKIWTTNCLNNRPTPQKYRNQRGS